MSIVAVVGRPNVGKSTLFNKLTGQKKAIVEDTPGVTRDRIYGTCEWNNKNFSLVDTGGIDMQSEDNISKGILNQSLIAIDCADVIVFMTDVRSGLVSTDMEVADILQKSGKPIILCVNKCDSVGSPPDDFYEFYNLGLGDPIALSSVHGHGTGDLLDKICEFLPDDSCENDDDTIKVAIVGKPNVGKSSLINKITNEERCLVSNLAGTTRDAIDTSVNNSYGNFIFTDTAGLRRQKKVYDNIEKYSVIRAKAAIERSDVCIIMIDANEGFTEQDSKVAGLAHEAGKACIIAVNKWDSIEKDSNTMKEYKKNLQRDFSFMSYAPFIFISAKTGLRLNELFALINDVYLSSTKRVSTGVLNDMLAQATLRVQPPTDKGKRLKIYYTTQIKTQPPTFVFFVNEVELFHFSYQRYLENQIRDTFGFEGTPIRIVSRNKREK
ncbi:MAG: ribosome biogenesis GTPase Der [Clostridia bacterium]|nr:ribosome biogenesis GTPase Der [Clostridia bacterium]